MLGLDQSSIGALVEAWNRVFLIPGWSSQAPAEVTHCLWGEASAGSFWAHSSGFVPHVGLEQLNNSSTLLSNSPSGVIQMPGRVASWQRNITSCQWHVLHECRRHECNTALATSDISCTWSTFDLSYAHAQRRRVRGYGARGRRKCIVRYDLVVICPSMSTPHSLSSCWSL